MTRKTNQKGFTLIELLITVAIVAILATIALPAYNQYRDRAKYAEVIHASEPSKTMIDVCVQTSSPPDCSSLTPPAGSTDADAVATVAIGGSAAAGYTVTVTPPATVAGYGIVAADTYIATGTVNASNQTVSWAISGGCLNAGYC